MKITRNVALEIISHEAIVPEAYKDSVGVWTWGVGVTNASGHKVYPRYKDNPQPLEKCIEVFLWLLETKYAPAVRKAFKKPLTESQFAAALSFHYNTGAISRANWVKQWNAGSINAARDSIMNWSKPESIIPRRKKEQTLFFQGIWSNDGKVNMLAVRKPSYTPKWSSASRVGVTEIIDNLLGSPDEELVKAKLLQIDDADEVSNDPKEPDYKALYNRNTARLQVLRDCFRETDWLLACADRPEMRNWFDGDGVPK